jgi:hypothetical protein
MPAFLNLTGKKYGRWTVDHREVFNSTSGTLWVCQCDCGTTRGVSTSSLRSGLSKSCGCLHREIVRRGRIHPTDMALSRLHQHLKHSAKQRGFCWSLTYADVAFFCSQNCMYCGLKPFQKFRNRYMVDRKVTYLHVPDFVYNGLDRVDNSLGYIQDNCVPCCGICNNMKGTMTREEFVVCVRRIADASIR